MPGWRRRTAEIDTRCTDTARSVGAEIQVEVTEPTTLDFQIAVSRQPGLNVDESLVIKLNGKVLEPREIVGEHQTRIHVVQAGQLAPVGQLDAAYVHNCDPMHSGCMWLSDKALHDIVTTLLFKRRERVAAQLEALRILIAKMSESPGRIPALG
jgi:hypothetical protein